MKKTLVVLAILVMAVSANAALSVGDVAIVEYQSDNPDALKVVALSDLAAGETLYFTDNGWKADNTFRANEGVWSYTVGVGGVSAGSVIDLIANGSQESGSLAFSASGDQALIYQGSDASPSFVYGLNAEGTAVWQADSTSSNTSALPTGLVNGTTAVALPELDNYVYSGITSGTKAELLAAIGDSANWTGSNSAMTGFSGTFNVVVPEPATMALLGMGALALIRRKK